MGRRKQVDLPITGSGSNSRRVQGRGIDWRCSDQLVPLKEEGPRVGNEPLKAKIK